MVKNINTNLCTVQSSNLLLFNRNEYDQVIYYGYNEKKKKKISLKYYSRQFRKRTIILSSQLFKNNLIALELEKKRKEKECKMRCTLVTIWYELN